MMKKRMKALLAIGLSAIIMVCSAGCGNGKEHMKAEIDPDIPVEDVSFPLKEKAELSFITSAPATSTQEPNERTIFERLEKQTNVHIDWTCFVSDQFNDKKNLALAQFGNLPDGLFNAGMSDYDLLRYAKQGIIIPVENLIDKYMPNLKAVLEKYPEYRTMCTAPDGHIYSFPWIEQLGAGKEAIQAIGDIPYINKKWLDYLKLDVPNTTEELEQVLIAFRDNADKLEQEFDIEGGVIPMSFTQNNWGTYGEKDSFNIFEMSENAEGGQMLKHMDLGDASPVEVREAQSVNGPLAILNEYYDVYVTEPADAKWRLDNMHETYLKDMNSKYVYPNVFMSIDDTNKVSQYDTDIKKYAEQKKADWILNGGIDKEWDSYLKKMEQYGLSDYLAIKQKYFDQYQKSLSETEK